MRIKAWLLHASPLLFALAARALECSAGSRAALCEELDDEGVELLQTRAGRGVRAKADVEVATALNATVNASASAVANASSAAKANASGPGNETAPALTQLPASEAREEGGALPDVVGNLVPDNIIPDSVAHSVEKLGFDSLITAMNSTVMELGVLAKQYLAKATALESGLVSDVRDAGDQALQKLESLVLKWVGPVKETFEAVVGILGSGAPVVVAAVEALGSSETAGGLKARIGKVESVAAQIDAMLLNATGIIGRLGNESEALMDRDLALLNGTIEAGIAKAAELEGALVEAFQRTLQDVADKLGVSLVAVGKKQRAGGPAESMDALMGEVQEIGETMKTATNVVFEGLYEATIAATDALKKQEKSGAPRRGAPAAVPAGLLLLAASLALH